MQIRKLAICAGMAVTLAAGLSVAACQGGTTGSGSTDTPAQYTADGQINDQYCLSCHGGSYEAVAGLTADLGDWNPHDPIHGGYNSCGNCHDIDMGTDNSYCDNCHEYAPGKETVGDSMK